MTTATLEQVSQKTANAYRWAKRQQSRVRAILSAPIDEFEPHPTLCYAFVVTVSDVTGGELSRLSRTWRIVTVMGTFNGEGLLVLCICCQSKRA